MSSGEFAKSLSAVIRTFSEKRSPREALKCFGSGSRSSVSKSRDLSRRWMICPCRFQRFFGRSMRREEPRESVLIGMILRPSSTSWRKKMAELREAVSRGVRNEIEEEFGDLLFTAVNLARKLGVDAETALTGATRKFIGRFRAMEKEIAAGGGRIEQTLPIEMDALWDKHKAATSSAR